MQSELSDSTCPKHAIKNSFICLSQTCGNRVCCEICTKTPGDSHAHRFYLDESKRFTTFESLQKDIAGKLSHYQEYVSSNIRNLGLPEFKAKIASMIAEEQMYLYSKFKEEVALFSYQLDRCKVLFASFSTYFSDQLHKLFQQVQGKANALSHCRTLVEQKQRRYLRQTISTQEQLQQSVSFLYSSDMLMTFNRNLDKVKDELNFVRAQRQSFFSEMEETRKVYSKSRLFLLDEIQTIKKHYERTRPVPEYKPADLLHLETVLAEVVPKEVLVHEVKEEAAPIAKEPEAPTEVVEQVMAFQPLDTVYRLFRLDNGNFVSSGGRNVVCWSKTSRKGEPAMACEHMSYGLTVFREGNRSHVLYGLSNGDIGQLDLLKNEALIFNGHQACVRQLFQYDNFHFFSCSFDRRIKMWALSKDQGQADSEAKLRRKQFADERTVLRGHKGRVCTATKFGRNILSGGSDAVVCLWDLQRGCVDDSYPHQKEVSLIKEVNKEVFATGGQFKSLKFWDYRKTKFAVASISLEYQASALLIVRPEQILLADRGAIRLFDIRNLRQSVGVFQREKVSKLTITDLVFLNQTEIVLGASDKLISLWKLN